MSHTPNRSCWMIVVDTDQYSGNFERELVAYMTGAVGDCDVGEPQSALAHKQLPEGFPEPLRFSDGGCFRPATIWPGPKKVKGPAYTSVMCAFEDRPTAEELATLVSRAREYFSTPLHRRYGSDPVPKVLGVDFTTSEQPKAPPKPTKTAAYYAGAARERERRLRQIARRRAR